MPAGVQGTYNFTNEVNRITYNGSSFTYKVKSFTYIKVRVLHTKVSFT